MVEIEVTVTCSLCNKSEQDWFEDSYEVEYFLNRLGDKGWVDELEICPDCAEKTIECSYCFESTPPGKTEYDLPELGWRQHTSADMRSVITLCKQCGEYYDQFRS